MCISKPEIICKAKSPRSPWRRHLREPVKPKLSRRIVSSARVNLNLHWADFEASTKSMALFELPTSLKFGNNEINENLANEIQELGN